MKKKTKENPLQPAPLALPVNLVVTSAPAFSVVAQMAQPVRIGTRIMPEGFITETGLLPRAIVGMSTALR
jgi:hypothetical protein